MVIKLQFKIMIFITITLVVVVGGVGLLTYSQLEKSIETQMGNNAMDIAVTIAAMDEVGSSLKDGFTDEGIQNTIEKFRNKTRFNYIIVIDMDRIKHSYPQEHGVGKLYKSGGEDRVIENGESYIYADKNVLISAIRAFVPVYYEGEQVGAVIVGLLNTTVYEEIKAHIKIYKVTIFVGLMIGILSASHLSNTIKKTIYNLEPKEIALLLGQRDIILHSLEYGIIAVDFDGKILIINKLAKEIFNFEDEDVGKYIWDVNLNYTNQLSEVFLTKKSIFNKEVKICAGKSLICSHKILFDHKGEEIGVLSSFSDLSKAKLLAEELTGFKKMTYALRASNHEYMNKLHTISGLIQLNEYDKAVDYISEVTNKQERITSAVNNRIKNSHVAAILMAKYFKATEKKIDMKIEVLAEIDELPNSLSEDDLCTVLGNLIENAIDEVLNVKSGEILVKLDCDVDGIWIAVSDNGRGIDEYIIKDIYKEGVSTKGKDHGYGMPIVMNIVKSSGGSIELIQDNGTGWELFFPFEIENEGDNDD